jgi:hypothetical protein
MRKSKMSPIRKSTNNVNCRGRRRGPETARVRPPKPFEQLALSVCAGAAKA